MVPFANRARENVLQIGTTAIQLTPNSADPFAIHGFGWQRAWQVINQDAESCVLVLGADPELPLRFEARISVLLVGNEVEFSLDLTNPGHEPIPAGLGWHPYFPHLNRTTLGFSSDAFWLAGPGQSANRSFARSGGTRFFNLTHSALNLAKQLLRRLVRVRSDHAAGSWLSPQDDCRTSLATPDALRASVRCLCFGATKPRFWSDIGDKWRPALHSRRAASLPLGLDSRFYQFSATRPAIPCRHRPDSRLPLCGTEIL